MKPNPVQRNPQIAILQDRNIRVLLADDNRVNQFLGKHILQNLGITLIDLVCSGNDAFEAASQNKYDLLLTDVEMPGMTGYELAHAIRNSETGDKRLLIIALTANASDEDREKAVAAGIDDYLTKPYTPQELQRVILRHLKAEEKIILQEMSIEAETPVTINPLKQVYELFHHNAADVRHFLAMLSHQLPSLMDQIKEGITNDDWNLAFQSAHKLKSPVNILGTKDVAIKLEHFTEDLRYRRDLVNSASRFEEILPSVISILVLVNRELEEME